MFCRPPGRMDFVQLPSVSLIRPQSSRRLRLSVRGIIHPGTDFLLSVAPLLIFPDSSLYNTQFYIFIGTRKAFNLTLSKNLLRSWRSGPTCLGFRVPMSSRQYSSTTNDSCRSRSSCPALESSQKISQPACQM